VALLHDESDQAALRKPNEAILFGIITALIFDVWEAQEMVEVSKIDLPPS